jgi:ABC-type multidrug transport system ATPase subunit/ABC-type transport system involved in multi-copper enzyme maturation permease subunit
VTAIIVADQLTKWYGSRLAVDRVSLEVRAGEVMGLLGPNGSGKTTVLRILTGYLCPSAGTARIAGLDVVDDPLAAKRRIGYVAEEVPLYDSMRVREFLEFMGRMKGLEGRPRVTAIATVVERLGLGPVMSLLTGQLSKGFRQRVAIAQALLADPEVLVLDEPTNGLDPRQIIEIRDLIRSLAGTRTLLVASHILGEIERVADRVAILLEGRLLGVHALGRTERPHRVRLQITGESGRVAACLRGVPGIAGVHIAAPGGARPGTYLADVESPSAAAALAPALIGHGFGLVELREEAQNLEALFLQLTAGPGTPSPADDARRPSSPGPPARVAAPARPGRPEPSPAVTAAAETAMTGAPTDGPGVEAAAGGRGARDARALSHLPALLGKEVRALFSSPIAYALIAVFLFLLGYTFTTILFLNKLATLTHIFFQMSTLFLLIVPAISMRLVAEERKTGTIELLLTAPVRESEVILAKFLASMVLIAVMLTLSGGYAAVLGLYGNPDWGPVYGGYLGLLLFAGALVAVGLLVSSLTANQVVAAVVCLGIFLLLWMIDSLGYLLPDPFDALSVNLSLLARFSPFAFGSVFLSNVGFFLSVIALGLFLAVRALARR